jgi:hypothetical protein
MAVSGVGRTKRSSKGPPRADLERFREVAGLVDRAKDALLSAVPRRRGPGVPVADALASFEDHLRAARSAIEGWPANDERGALKEAIDGSLRRAEALRLEASPEGYEELYALLGEILDPLDAVEGVAGQLRGASS